MMFSTQRKAIAMIELIFAIVVMGIVMMSAPQMLATASQSGYTTIQQEGINEAAAQMNMILDYPWDENDSNSSHTTVLFVNNGDPGLNATRAVGGGTPIARAGTPMKSDRLYITSAGLPGGTFNASPIGLDSNENNLSIKDDIDDFNQTSVNLTLDGIASAIDYIEKGGNINIARTVTYMEDNATYNNGGVNGILAFSPNFTTPKGTTNIKQVQVTLTSTSGVTELSKTITLRAFSCNIGTYELEKQ